MSLRNSTDRFLPEGRRRDARKAETLHLGRRYLRKLFLRRCSLQGKAGVEDDLSFSKPSVLFDVHKGTHVTIELKLLKNLSGTLVRLLLVGP